MLKGYIGFLRGLCDSVFSSKNLCSFSDYLEAVWRGFLLIFVILLTVAVVVAIVALPFVFWTAVWNLLSGKLTTRINQAYRNSDMRLVNELIRKMKSRKTWYIVLVVIGNIPFILPLILMLFDIVS